MVDHIDSLCDKLFHCIAFDADHALKSLLPPLCKNPRYNLRNQRPYNMPHVCLEMDNLLKWVLFIKVSGQITNVTMWK